MKEEQLTAVEWLEDEVDRIIETYDVDMMRYPLEKAYEQAKEMEKEQMINARQSGIDATINGKSISNIDYYNETFKSE